MRHRLSLIILTAILFSCNNTETPKMNQEDKFTWNIQMAGYDHNQADQKGETDYQNFQKAFDQFPWNEQIIKANQSPDRCAPTITASDLKNGKDFWISMAGNEKEVGYIIGYIYPKKKKTLLGFGKIKTIRWLEMFTAEDKNKIDRLIKLFFNRDYSSFETSIRKLDSFGQMESEDLAK